MIKKAARQTTVQQAALSKQLKLQYEFLKVRITKAQAAASNGGSMARTNADNFPGFNQLMLKLKCIQVAATLDHGTQWVRDNWNNLTQDQRDTMNEALSDLLNSYSDTCT